MRIKRQNKSELKLLKRIVLLFLVSSLYVCKLTNANHLDKFQTGNLISRENVFLHLDKPYFLSGTELNYSAYITSRISKALSDKSDVLYVRMLNLELEVVLTQQVVIENGRTQGRMLISDSLQTGTYLIIAYTNKMLNSTKNHFKQAIEIVNPKDPISTLEADQFAVNFYPEGGHLVDGHLSNVVCEVIGSNLPESGFVISNYGDTVAILKNFNNNYSDFNLLPVDTLSYRVHLTINSKLHVFNLNDVESTAVTCKAIGLQSDTITLLVNTGSLYRGPDIGILVQNNHQTILSASQAISGSRIKFAIPKNSLGSGINYLIVYDYKKRFLTSRAVYIEEESLGSISIKPNKKSFKSKEKIKVPITFNYPVNDETRLSLSVSIKNLDFFDSISTNRIDYYTDIFSGINSLFKDPEITSRFQDKKSFDNFLKTQILTEVDIPSLLNYSIVNQNVEPTDTHEYFIISGYVRDDSTKQPVADSLIYCTVVGDKPQFFSTVTGKGGRFRFQVRSFTGSADIIIKLSNVNELRQNVSYIIDPPIYDYTRVQIKSEIPSLIKENAKAYSFYRKQDLLIQRVYNPIEIKNRVNREQKKTIGFFSRYDFEMDLTEYELLNDFQEISRELIPGLSIKGKGDNQSIYLREKESRNKRQEGDVTIYDAPLVLMDTPPLFLIDGLPVFTSNTILNIEPAKLKGIKLLNERYFINGVIHNGVLELSTLEADYYKKHETNHFSYRKQGFYQPNENLLNRLNEHNDLDEIPNFQDILYWNPSLSVQANGTEIIEFTASDDHSDFLIEVQGVDSDGKTYYEQTIFSIGK